MKLTLPQWTIYPPTPCLGSWEICQRDVPGIYTPCTLTSSCPKSLDWTGLYFLLLDLLALSCSCFPSSLLSIILLDLTRHFPNRWQGLFKTPFCQKSGKRKLGSNETFYNNLLFPLKDSQYRKGGKGRELLCASSLGHLAHDPTKSPLWDYEGERREGKKQWMWPRPAKQKQE